MKLGIIGNGDSAHSFASASFFADGVELVGIAGRNLERVKPMQEKYGAPAMSIEDLLKTDLDCVAVSTPPGLHGPHVLPFIRKGVHAIIEKPMALCVADCDTLMAEASRAGVKIMVSQTHRYNPYGRLSRQLVESGKYGKPVSVYIFLGHDYFTGKRSGWQLEHELSGGGVTFNPFIHMVDFARYVACSEAKSFHGVIGYHKPGYAIEGDVHCLLEFENGAAGVVEIDGYNHRPGHVVDVILEDGALLIRPSEKRIDVLSKGRVVEVHGLAENGRANEKGIYGHYGYVGHVVEMRDAIEKGGPITSDGANGRANVVIARGILEEAGVKLPGPTI